MVTDTDSRSYNNNSKHYALKSFVITILRVSSFRYNLNTHKINFHVIHRDFKTLGCNKINAQVFDFTDNFKLTST